MRYLPTGLWTSLQSTGLLCVKYYKAFPCAFLEDHDGSMYLLDDR